jgi:uncharacterized protein (DUF427 family)
VTGVPVAAKANCEGEREMAQETENRGRVRVEEGRKRVRAYLGGTLVADTLNPRLVWEKPYYPTYYVPAGDVKAELVATGKTEHSPSRGDAALFDVVAGNVTAQSAARRYPDSPLEALRDLVRLEFDAMTEWFEEDEPIYVHPRDPYTRIDILASSRHIRVEIDGVTVADSHHPHILFETGLRPRYYLPMTDIRLDLMRPSATQTHCPYKGSADYWSVDTGTAVHEDVVWFYRTPLAESQKITGLASFYNEKVDVYVDGVLQERPKTKFS